MTSHDQKIAGTFLALFFSPLTVPIVLDGMFISSIIFGTISDHPFKETFAVLLLLTLYSTAISYIVVWSYGILVHLILSKLGLTHLWFYLIAGILGPDIFICLNLTKPIISAIDGLLFFGMIGGSVATTFWFLAVHLPMKP